MKLPMRGAVCLRLCDVSLGDFSHTLLVLHSMLRTRMGHYIGIHTSCVCFQIGVGICTVPMADVVMSGVTIIL